MRRFMTIPVEVEAMQYTGETFPEDIVNGYYSIDWEYIDGMSQGFTLKCNDGTWVRCNPGNWIVRDQYGDISILDDKSFKSKYQEIYEYENDEPEEPLEVLSFNMYFPADESTFTVTISQMVSQEKYHVEFVDIQFRSIQESEWDTIEDAMMYALGYSGVDAQVSNVYLPSVPHYPASIYQRN